MRRIRHLQPRRHERRLRVPITPCTPCSTAARRAAASPSTTDGVIRCYKDAGLVNDVIHPRRGWQTLGTGTMAVGHVRYGTSGARSAPATPSRWWSTMSRAAWRWLTTARLTNAAGAARGAGAEGLHLPHDQRFRGHFLYDYPGAAALQVHRGGRLPRDGRDCRARIRWSSCRRVSSSPRATHTASGRCASARWARQHRASPRNPARWTAIGAHLRPRRRAGRDRGSGSRTACAPTAPHVGEKPKSTCVFEYIYFARPDSVIDGCSACTRRGVRAGAFLALEHPVQADVVIGVPDSGLDAAIGYSRQIGHSLRHRLHQEQVHRPYLHPAHAGRAARTRCASS